ncbi:MULTISPECIES: SPOR domain-containing protein [unclassified Sphingopyxis]|uniref:SPOR domain-containing protein n=1 Tax=unclassified Sphingopyxis TaxID=2614943 RepID=UPI0028625824|nr:MULTISPECIES: SPOR domain-containing protein [unclassified Sphingopyxis]MDR6831844.1 cell division septation protein DedD [Sphingopyxis sp. BE122]MDR7227586.1 cell division septation protein DedD [Sphingopyxis sp. BE259]
MAEDKNADQGDAGLGLESEDRLPWLEAADGVEEDGEVSPARLLVMVLGGLLLIGAVLGGLWWVQNGGARGKGELIAAQEGNYKVAPKNDGAKTFEGEGDASFSASEGAEPAGKVDPTRMPEEPAVTPQEREAAKAAADKAAVAKAKPKPAPVKAAPKVVAAPAKAPAAAPKAAPAPAAVGSAMIQLGAFSSDAAAAKAWTNLSKRFAYLADLNKSVSPAKVGDGTVYRLRVSAGTAANAANLCGKLRVAGENCVVVR